jgi:methionyl-tRNA formyltransferase
VTAPARTVFLGSGAFAVPIVEALADAPEVELRAVVTAPARKSGRGLAETSSPVGAWAVERGLPTLRPVRLREPEALAAVGALEPELLVLADYGRIVPDAWLAIPRFGALNVHPSLLPRHRGAAPIPAAILAGDHETGTTLMRMDAGVDTGPIVAQRSIALRGDEVAPDLEHRLATLGAALLRESLQGWLAGRIAARAQPSDGVTVTRPLTREDGRLDPAASASELERQVRAYQPWPGSFIDTGAGRLVVWRARSAGEAETSEAGDRPTAGSLVALGYGLGFVTADGILELQDVQRAGGRRMSGADLVRGMPGWIGERARPRE